MNFDSALPLVKGWIHELLSSNRSRAQSVESFGFKSLPLFYSEKLLRETKVVLVDKCPLPPLSAFGLPQFADFETMHGSGITYLDTYFVVKGESRNEALHFHELIHVIQWQELGADKFLQHYADGLVKHGYRNSPLEVMAYDHATRFKSKQSPYRVESEVRQQCSKLQ